MKSRLYYVLFVFYVLMVAFILYINGVFTGEISSFENVVINVGFLLIIGILFVISAISFGRLNRCTKELVEATKNMQQQYKAENGRNLWNLYQDKKDIFVNDELKQAFHKYRARIKGYQSKNGYLHTCDLDEYINEDTLDRIGMSYFNSGISGTLTGLGILGTFLGLSMGLGSFNGDDIYTISDNVGPLLSGMKVAFHTSVYGIFFSLIFNFVYRSIMSDAYDKLEDFSKTFRQCVQPVASTEDGNSAVMLMYQANMSGSMKQILELMKGNAVEQTAGVERIVEQFVEQMNEVLGLQLQRMGSQIKSANDMQTVNINHTRDLVKETASIMEANQKMMDVLTMVMERQDAFSKELKEQREKLDATCDEISNQLYTFEQMRNLYEK